VRRNAEVAVWWDDARKRRLPLVCVFSGEPASDFRQFGELSIPAMAWLILLLLPLWALGGLPGGGFLSIQLPVSEDWRRRLRVTSGLALATMPPTVILVVAAFSDWFGLSILFWVIGAAFFGTSMGLTLWRESWQPRYSERFKDEHGAKYIVLRGVHPLFAEAVERKYRED